MDERLRNPILSIAVRFRPDTDGDGQCDVLDPDDDNDGVVDGSDSAALNPDVCRTSMLTVVMIAPWVR